MKKSNDFGLFVGMRNVLLIYSASAFVAIASIALYKMLIGTF